MELLFFLNVILLYPSVYLILEFIQNCSCTFVCFLLLESNKDNHLNQSKMVNLTKKKQHLPALQNATNCSPSIQVAQGIENKFYPLSYTRCVVSHSFCLESSVITVSSDNTAKKKKKIEFPIIIDQLYLFRIDEALRNYSVADTNHSANA